MISLRNSLWALCVVFACNNHSTNHDESTSVSDSISLDAGNSIDKDTTLSFDSLVNNYEDPERTSWQNPDLVISKLGALEGKTVADIGAGTGYFTFKLAPYASKVVAIDIDERFLEYIEEQKRDLPAQLGDKINVKLSEETDPLLGVSTIDVALLVNTYYFIPNRVEYLKKVKTALKEEGIIAIVDFRKSDLPLGPPVEYQISAETAHQELRNAGFSKIKIDSTSLKFQYIIIAE